MHKDLIIFLLCGFPEDLLTERSVGTRKNIKINTFMRSTLVSSIHADCTVKVRLRVACVRLVDNRISLCLSFAFDCVPGTRFFLSVTCFISREQAYSITVSGVSKRDGKCRPALAILGCHGLCEFKPKVGFRFGFEMTTLLEGAIDRWVIGSLEGIRKFHANW